MNQSKETLANLKATHASGHSDEYDVAVVGYGPAGEVLASTLGAAGFRVLVVERWPQPYPLPRLTTLDGEVCRVVQATGIDTDMAFQETSVQDACHFVDAAGAPLMVVKYPGLLGGWPSRVSVFQPDFERSIAAKVATMLNVDVLRGWEATSLSQTDDVVTLGIAPFSEESGVEHNASRVIRAKYLVGTDGARSFVRAALDIQMRDFDLHERWLNFDAEILRPLPDELLKLKIFMDPARPHMHMPIGKRRLRLEFRVMEGETDEAMTHPDVAWDFLSRQHGLGPEDVRIMRQVVYHYHTRVTSQWRTGRVFLAGDAAHTMPPYMGQGGCAAIRDGRNLGWKLVEVLAGRSTDALLDEYGAERGPHVTTLVMASDRLSRVVNIVDVAAAEARNQGMREKGEGHPPELPSLQAGVLYRDAAGIVAAGSGRYTPQGRLRRDGIEDRGDQFLGGAFQLWCRKDPAAFIGAQALDILDRLGCKVGVFEDATSEHAFEDIDGTYLSFLDSLDADVAIVRPDFYLFGAVRANGIDALVADLFVRLHSNSIGESVRAPAQVVSAA
ncbi:3-(3-hydroxyphenyl)propionate hydroxylase [Caballeronia hypogeia]|uniref:3-(3-hydroxyphenyl)propionate hydroxylase n=1 Tax=Caballeronia hypogeia TaxID=1777140 RepID=A0A158CVL0_9BURK|nr:bifunctional 3-(3-hydroxy-phenyl)propionate/3-hydroxycinnamic acid hydroxylase [Caballeronia hypogeia]SAK86412.1 3-(3-hydroxyphenyl)propionate hydroxylase [Caballeronia hypogeia]